VSRVTPVIVDGRGAATMPRSRPVCAAFRSAQNVSDAGGANLGIRDAIAGGAEVVLVLDDDARGHRGAVRVPLRVLDADPRVAAVGAKVVARADPKPLWLAGAA